jgi:hypothetical protein
MLGDGCGSSSLRVVNNVMSTQFAHPPATAGRFPPLKDPDHVKCILSCQCIDCNGPGRAEADHCNTFNGHAGRVITWQDIGSSGGSEEMGRDELQQGIGKEEDTLSKISQFRALCSNSLFGKLIPSASAQDSCTSSEQLTWKFLLPVILSANVRDVCDMRCYQHAIRLTPVGCALALAQHPIRTASLCLAVLHVAWTAAWN